VALQISSFPSSNYSNRPKSVKINSIVIHHTDMTNVHDALNLLCSPKNAVSCHYLIGKDGKVYQLVADELRASHAGQSFWRGKEAINDYSIGIELDNNGNEPFAKSQMKVLLQLCQELLKRHPIEQRNIVAHADIAPHRKVDPNKFFDWEYLWQNGIGIYSDLKVKKPEVLFKYGSNHKDIVTIKKKLVKFGYGITNLNGEFDLEFVNVSHAFKRHYCIETYDNFFWDTLADARLTDLLKQAGQK
jgi:N-acetylmuramoyl-L-alanine amidase